MERAPDSLYRASSGETPTKKEITEASVRPKQLHLCFTNKVVLRRLKNDTVGFETVTVFPFFTLLPRVNASDTIFQR